MKDLPCRMQRLLMVQTLLTGLVAAATLVFYHVLHFRLALIWNLFLAGLPLVFSLLILRAERRRSPFVAKCALWALWLFFFPNAPYMLTDLVHITRYEYYRRGVGFLPLPLSWFGLFHLAMGIALGVLYGTLSLYLLHELVARRCGGRWGWLFCAAVSALCGPAIHIGRFMRFNTWDIVVRPHRILAQVWQSLSVDTFLLYAVFAAMTFLPYLLFYCLAKPESTG